LAAWHRPRDLNRGPRGISDRLDSL
jgi:hypothetical protein